MSLYYYLEVKNSMRLRFISFTLSFPVVSVIPYWFEKCLYFGYMYNVVLVTVIHWYIQLSSCLPQTVYYIVSSSILISCFQSIVYPFFKYVYYLIGRSLQMEYPKQLFGKILLSLYYEQIILLHTKVYEIKHQGHSYPSQGLIKSFRLISPSGPVNTILLTICSDKTFKIKLIPFAFSYTHLCSRRY